MGDKHIEKIDFCVACGQEETIRHALFECTWAKLCWAEIKQVAGIKVPELHPNSWAMDIRNGARKIVRGGPIAVAVMLGRARTIKIHFFIPRTSY